MMDATSSQKAIVNWKGANKKKPMPKTTELKDSMSGLIPRRERR